MQWSLYQSNQSPGRLYLSQSDVRSLVADWTRYEIGVSCFHRWKKLLGESVPGSRRIFYTNYLLAKFVRYAELMIQFGDEQKALDAFWDELDTHRSQIEQMPDAASFTERYKRQLLKEEYTHGILGSRDESQSCNQETDYSTGVWRTAARQIVTVPVAARAV